MSGSDSLTAALDRWSKRPIMRWVRSQYEMHRACRANRRNVCFSNRPFGVKRFQTIHQFSVDVARGLVLLFGIGTKALPSWDSKTRWNNLWGSLAVRTTVGSSGHTISPHPSSREGRHSTARWSSSFPPIAFDPAPFSCRCDFPGPAELGAVNPDAVHDHGQPAR